MKWFNGSSIGFVLGFLGIVAVSFGVIVVVSLIDA
jgi:hypothetical protein